MPDVPRAGRLVLQALFEMRHPGNAVIDAGSDVFVFLERPLSPLLKVVVRQVKRERWKAILDPMIHSALSAVNSRLCSLATTKSEIVAPSG